MKSKIFRALISLVIAIGLWMYVITVVSPGSEANFRAVPVTLQNESILTERGLMVTSATASVDLTLSGNRTDLNKITSSSMSVTASLSGITAAGTYQLNYTPSYPGIVSGNALAVQSRKPDFVTVTVAERRTKNVDVEVDFVGSVPEGFLADKDNVELDHPQIEITGPAEAVDQVAKARIVIDLDHQSSSVSGGYVYTLCTANNEPVDAAQIVTNIATVNCTVRIQRFKEIALKVKLIPGGGANEENCTVSIAPQTIRVSGSDTLLENLDELEIGTVDLGVLTENVQQKYTITLPDGINNETGVSEAEVSIQLPKLKTKKLRVSRILATNVPENMEVDLITQAVEVTVRGPETVVHSITENDITVMVDFTDAQTGTATAKANVSLGGEFGEAGAIGTYSVSYTLKEKD